MRWRHVVGGSVAIVLSLASLASRAIATNLPILNEWHPCTLDLDAASSLNNSSLPPAECVTVTMPLCHSDVCDDSANRTIELFVKRIPATSSASTRHFWFVPDHPLAMTAPDAEYQMVLLHQQLRGAVSVYRMDQRGTGRSTRFDCAASQATSANSTLGIHVASNEVATCTTALYAAFGNRFAAAFSLTSAARDVVTFVSNFQAKTKVFLYGVGVGTLLVERTMHFPSDEIVGFVMDSTMTTSGGTKNAFPYRSRSDKAVGDVAKAFVALCDDDASCSRRFKGKKLESVVVDVLDAIDQAKAPCAAVITTIWGSSPHTAASEPASYAVRRLLAMMLEEPALRSFIPAVTYRFHRCDASDVDVLAGFISQLKARLDVREDAFVASSGAGAALLVYDLIQFSELWEDPPPSQSELLKRSTKALASDGLAYRELERYCAFTLDTTSACRGFKANATVPLRYTRDIHWNQPSTIKEHASVLFLTSRYDGDAPVRDAQTLMEALVGESKQLLEFDSAAHSVLGTTPLESTAEDHSLDETPPSSCARTILASFVDNDGDLNSLDKSCMDQLPTTVSLAISAALSVDVLGVANPYDGVLPVTSGSSSSNQSGSGSGGESGRIENPHVSVPHSNSNSSTTTTASLEQSRNRYRTAFIVLLVLAIVLLIIVVFLLYRARQRKRLEDEELQLRKLRGEEQDDMEFLRDLYNPSPSEWFNYRSNRLHL